MKDKQKKLLKSLIVNFGIVSKACKEADVSSSSHYRWMKEDEGYAEAVEELSNHYLDFVEGKLYELIDGGNTAAIIFYMKTKGKKRGYTQTLDVNAKVDGNVNVGTLFETDLIKPPLNE